LIKINEKKNTILIDNKDNNTESNINDIILFCKNKAMVTKEQKNQIYFIYKLNDFLFLVNKQYTAIQPTSYLLSRLVFIFIIIELKLWVGGW